MSFDYSRISFDPLKDYYGVVMQQGRVQLDADWNEMFAQVSRRVQAEAMDTFGENVVPRKTPNGFLIRTSVAGFSIGSGRIYVDGILADVASEFFADGAGGGLGWVGRSHEVAVALDRLLAL